MEESSSTFEQALNTNSNLLYTYSEAHQHEFQGPIANSMPGYSSNAKSLKSIKSIKKFKSIILKKRQYTNQTITHIQGDLQESTDNDEEECSVASKSLGKQVQDSCVLKDIKILQYFFSFPVDFKLLYRASDHHFSVQKFHQLCDDETDTLVICKTKNNQIIGGYTPLTWLDDFQQRKTYFKTDKKNQTFVFSVTKNQKFKLADAKKNRAICCFKNWGPTFGGGYDLQIGDKADSNYSSTSYFPRSFISSNKSHTYKYLTGCKNKEFKILQWQVYKVTKSVLKQQQLQDKQIQKGSSFLMNIKKGILGLLFQKSS